MGVGTLTITAVGAQTAPDAIVATAGASLSATQVQKDYGVKDVAFFPALKAVLFADGMDFQWHTIDNIVYLTGPLSPGTAPGVTPTAVRATAVLTFTGVSNAAARPSNGDQIQLGRLGGQGAGYITFKTTLDVTSVENQVLIGANVDATIANLTKLINGTGTQGTEFWSGRMALNNPTTGYAEIEDYEVSTSQAYGVPSATTATITFRAKSWGVIGNSYVAREVTDAGGVMSGLSTVFSGGTAGTGTAPEVGDYDYGYAYYRAADFAITGISPTASAELGVNSNVSLTFTASPTRDGTGYYRPMRTLIDGNKYYKLDDTASSPYTDDNTDATISGDFAEIYDPSVSRPYAGGYPTRYRFHTVFKGAVFGAGALLSERIDDSTTASVTVNSKTVTLSSGTRLGTDWIGRIFRVDGVTDEYVINDVSLGGPTLTLNRDYVGGTNGTASYTVTDERDPFEIYYSAALLPNSWPVANSLRGVYSPDPTGITGLTAAWDSLAVHTRTGTWRILGDADSGFQIVPIGEGMGAFTNQAVVNVEGNLLWLGPDGAFSWNGAADPRCLSNPEVSASGQPLGISGTLTRINLDAADGIVGQFNPSENVVRWWVPLDESPYNSHVIVYDTQTGAFTLDDCPPVTSVGLLIGPDGQYQTVVGTAFGGLWQLDLATSDGGFGSYEPVETVSSYDAATLTITLTGSPGLPTSGLEGARILHVTSAGDVQHGTIATTTATTIVLVSPLTTAPALSDTVVIGGIEFSVRTGRSNFAMPDGRKTLSSVTVDYTPQDVGQLWCAAAYDENDPSVFTLRSGTVDVATLTATDGEKQFFFRKGKGRRFTIQFLGLTPGYDIEVHGYVPVLRGRDPKEQVS